MENKLNAVLHHTLAMSVVLGLAAATYTVTKTDPQLATCAAEVGYLRRCAAAKLCGAGAAKGDLLAGLTAQKDWSPAPSIIEVRN
jgi:hypothetical protein